MSSAAEARGPASEGHAAHLIAVLTGVPVAALMDRRLLGGLMIAAASAAGIHAPVPPQLMGGDPRGVDGMLLFAGGHLALHADPETERLRVDVVVTSANDPGRALDVMVRRLGPRGVQAQLVYPGSTERAR